MSEQRASAAGQHQAQWAAIVTILLLAWALRLCYLEEVPPGWRDDELINTHALSNQLLEGSFPLYYPGASGHEPLYHHLHAGVHAVLGFNVLSGHILSVVFGTLSVALTYSLVRNLFPRKRRAALVASLMLATSFWSLMYSRTAIRHISLLPFALLTLHVLWRQLDEERSTRWGWWMAGLLLAASFYTYTASRLLPVLIGLFFGYLGVFHGHRFLRHWRGAAAALVVGVLLTAPLGIAIARNRSRRAIEGIGADARVTELAEPLRALSDGDPRPVVAHTVKTLGMFHAGGDPEWLYNISGRPVFNVLGAVMLWSGVALCLSRWREPRFFLLLPWLGLGLSPAFISVPPSSLGHTILAQPAAYILPAIALEELGRWLRLRGTQKGVGMLLLGAVIATNTIRDVRDYFIVWPQRGMVRLLYRADYREAARFLDEHQEISDVAVGSGLMGPWDRIALDVDIQRQDVAPRLFHPRRALVWPAGDEAVVLLPSWPELSLTVENLLGPGEAVSSHLSRHSLPAVPGSLSMPADTWASLPLPSSGYTFANGLTLARVWWAGAEAPGDEEELQLLALWHVSDELELPPMPVIAQPPPPGVDTGPRVSGLAHLLDGDGEVVAIDDGLWVDPLTLQPDDSFVQVHRFSGVSEAAVEPQAVQLGLYDPKTDERWPTLSADGQPDSDVIRIPLGEER